VDLLFQLCGSKGKVVQRTALHISILPEDFATGFDHRSTHEIL